MFNKKFLPTCRLLLIFFSMKELILFYCYTNIKAYILHFTTYKQLDFEAAFFRGRLCIRKN